MVDLIRTETGQKLNDSRSMDSCCSASPYLVKVCKIIFGPALIAYVYLERYYEGVSFRGCVTEEGHRTVF